jgi:hypothetical protein
VPRIVLAAVTVVAVLLMVPLAYAVIPGFHRVAARQTGLPSTGRLPSGNSPQAAAIPGVEAKTGLRFTEKCATTSACLSLISQTVGQNAAAVVFSTASTGGRRCAGYVFHRDDSWHLLDAVCSLPDQLSPLVGHDATVHVPGSCANVRNAASLTAHVVSCVHDGTAVHIDGGPTYADGHLWWHESLGWMAHDFLVGP